MHQIIIFSTLEAQVTVDGVSVPYVNATITLTPDEDSTSVQAGLFSHLNNKQVTSNVNEIFVNHPVNPETEPDIIDASCCDEMIQHLIALGYEIELN